MRDALVIFLVACGSPAPGSIPNEACAAVLGGPHECYSLRYTRDPSSSAECPAIDPYLGPPGEVDYAFYKSPNGSCTTHWESCAVTDDCTQKDGTREHASIEFNVDRSGIRGTVTATKGSMTCTYRAQAGPLHVCK